MTLLLLTHSTALHVCDDTSWNDPLVQQTHNLWQEDLLDHVVEDCCASVYMQLRLLCKEDPAAETMNSDCDAVEQTFLLLAIVWSTQCSPCFVVGWRVAPITTMTLKCWLKTTAVGNAKTSWGTRVVKGSNWGIRVWEPESGNPRGVGEPALRNQSWELEFGSQSYCGTREIGEKGKEGGDRGNLDWSNSQWMPNQALSMKPASVIKRSYCF